MHECLCPPRERIERDGHCWRCGGDVQPVVVDLDAPPPVDITGELAMILLTEDSPEPASRPEPETEPEQA